MGYCFRLAARVLSSASSHRQDNTYHGLDLFVVVFLCVFSSFFVEVVFFWWVFGGRFLSLKELYIYIFFIIIIIIIISAALYTACYSFYKDKIVIYAVI